MTQVLASRDLWESATEGRRSVNLVAFSEGDARGSAFDSLPQPAREPSAGGDMTAYSPFKGRPCGLSGMWAPRAAAMLRAGAASPVGVENDEIF